MKIAIVCHENMYPRLVAPIKKMVGIEIEIAGPLKSLEEAFFFIQQQPDGFVIDGSLSFWEEVNSFPINKLVYKESKSYAVQVVEWIQALQITLPKEKKPKEGMVPPKTHEDSMPKTGILILSKTTNIVDAVKKINGVHVLNVMDSIEDFKAMLQVHSPQVVLLDETVFPDTDLDKRRLQVIFRMLDILQVKAIKLCLLVYKRDDKTFYTSLIERGMFNFISKKRLSIQDIEQLIKVNFTFKDVEEFYEKPVEKAVEPPKNEMQEEFQPGQPPVPPLPYTEQKVEQEPIVEPQESDVEPLETAISAIEGVAVEPSQPFEQEVEPPAVMAEVKEEIVSTPIHVPKIDRSFSAIKKKWREEDRKPLFPESETEIRRQEPIPKPIQQSIHQTMPRQRSRNTLVPFYSPVGGAGTTTLLLHASQFLAEHVRVCVVELTMGGMASLLQIVPDKHILEWPTDYELNEMDVLNHSISFNGISFFIQPLKWVSYPPNLGMVRHLLRHLNKYFDVILVDLPQDLHNPIIHELFGATSKIQMVSGFTLKDIQLVRKAMRGMEQMGVQTSKIDVVINKYPSKSRFSLAEFEKMIGCEMGSVIPYDAECGEYMESGKLYGIEKPRSAFGKEVVEWVQHALMGKTVGSFR